MKNVIYKIRNVVNQHYYVGSTVDSRKRFWAHRKALRTGTHDCIHLQRAWNKYGEDCFKFEIVEQLDSKDALYPAEQKWLDAHFGQPYCYNVAAHADSPMRDASPELRAKVAAGVSRYAAEHGSPRTGHTHTDETKKRIRQSKLDNPQKYWEGKERPPETRAKISAAQKGVPKAPGRRVSPEGLAKIMAAAAKGHFSHWKGRTHTAEARAKLSKRVCAIAPDGTETIYPSLTETLNTMGFLMPTLTRALKSGKPLTKGKLQGWSFKYVDPA
jgi:group I intron endonuclease